MPFAPPRLFFYEYFPDHCGLIPGIGITTTIINEMEMDNGD